mgnify:FL=1
MKATVIVSIYKNVRALEAVLHSLEQQTEQDFELILSEDGEDRNMAAFINGYAFPWKMRHLTQDDTGWRKERALNRAVAAARTDWLIFVDGDCVLHPRFVEMHIKYAQSGTILAGKRVRLSAALSEKVMQTGKVPCLLPYLVCPRGCSHVEEGFFLYGAQWLRRGAKHLIGSNMSLSRTDLMAINGFDENYLLPATGEDYDIEWRMQRNGCKIVSVKNLAVQYHLYHKENWTNHDENMVYCKQLQAANQIVCKNGIQKL